MRGDGRVKVLCYHYGLQTCESCKGKGRGDEGRWSCVITMDCRHVRVVKVKEGEMRGDGRVKVLCYHYGLQTCESCKGKGRGDEGR